MKKCKLLYVSSLIALSTFISGVSGQNLLDTSTWTIGSGNVGSFYTNGTAAENVREWGKNHVGEDVIIWKAIPDSNSDADGGWNASYISIDNTQKYRLSVWIKKTNSNDGYSYFGCQQWQPDTSINNYTILNLNNTANYNPYFWVGDLPKLDRWYLLVGFVHGKNASTTSNEGAIYDGVTGELVQNITDFKFNTSTTILRHRAYLYYDTNTTDRQYFYAPRMELVNGGEMPLNILLSLNPNSQLLFAYDNAGNQKQRFYCPDGNSCTVPTPLAGKSSGNKEDLTNDDDVFGDDVNLDRQLKIYPNPTNSIVNIEIDSEILKRSESIRVFNTNSTLVKTLKKNNTNQRLEVDLSGMPTGVYFLHIHMKDGSSSITKKIIKN